MRRKWVIVSAVAAILALVSFNAGRKTEVARENQRNKTPAPELAPDSSLESKPEEERQLVISDISTVPFAELHDLLRSAAREQRAAWAAQLEGMAPGPKRNAALSSFFKTIVQFEAKEATSLIDKMHDRASRQIAAQAMFRAAPTSAMPEMARFFRALPRYTESGIQGFLGEALEEWSLVDPVAVSRFFDEHPEDIRLQSCSDLVLFQWAKIDPGAAQSWFQRQKPFPDTEEGQRWLSEAVHGFVYGWYNNDRAAALDFAVANAASESFKEVIVSMSLTLFLKSDDDAKAFIERLPSGMKAEALRKVVSYTTTGVVLGRRVPESERSPEAMAKWMITLPRDAWQDEIAQVADLWERADAGRFSAWLNQLPTETRDEVTAKLCSSGDKEHPDEVMTRAMTITDARLREEALTLFARGFGETPEEAAEALKKSQLSPAEKAYLVKLVQ